MSELGRLKPSTSKWIDEHQHLLKPPVGNQQVWKRRGPDGHRGRRSEPRAPISMTIRWKSSSISCKWRHGAQGAVDNGKHLRRADPRGRGSSCCRRMCGIRRSGPQEGSVGLVVEPKRRMALLDAFEWYCFKCKGLVHRVEVDLETSSTICRRCMREFYGNEAARTCPHCRDAAPRQGATGRVGRSSNVLFGGGRKNHHERLESRCRRVSRDPVIGWSCSRIGPDAGQDRHHHLAVRSRRVSRPGYPRRLRTRDRHGRRQARRRAGARSWWRTMERSRGRATADRRSLS